MNQIECWKCGKKMQPGEEAEGMNVGLGPQYWCRACAPVRTPEELMQAIDNVVNPPKEPGRKKK